MSMFSLIGRARFCAWLVLTVTTTDAFITPTPSCRSVSRLYDASSPLEAFPDLQNGLATKDVKDTQILSDIADPLPEEDNEQREIDEQYMREAINMAESVAGLAYPHASVGAVLVSGKGKILGRGASDYRNDAIRSALADAGVYATPLSEWCVTWPSASLRQDLANSTLYVTLEPSSERQGTATPPITDLLIEENGGVGGIRRVVIGALDPVPERASLGAADLHAAGIEVSAGHVLIEECQALVAGYADLCNSKLRRMARKHYNYFKRPLGFLHCSVVDSDNLEAFASHGNAFGTNFGGKNLGFRNFGAYEIAPPPEVIWADEDDDGGAFEPYDSMQDDDDFDIDTNMFEVDFEEEEAQETIQASPMMPWYEQVDAVVATFPKPGNGPKEDSTLEGRLNGLKWLATHGEQLPPGVERILVMDATDLKELPLKNGNSNLPVYVNVEEFWRGTGRKPTRVLLRRGSDAQARAVAAAAAAAAKAASDAAQAAVMAIETGAAESAAEAALEYQQKAQEATAKIQNDLQANQQLKHQLEEMGVIVEVLEGNEPIDVMNHLGERSGLQAVVWRAGCWGQRGVDAIMAGAFQWVSAHLAVDAVGGKFWQLMLAENAVQAACGPQRKVKVLAEPDDISLEYCDEPEADSDCSLTIEGRPVRHIRLDCRVAIIDESRGREFVTLPTKRLDDKAMKAQAPWFL